MSDYQELAEAAFVAGLSSEFAALLAERDALAKDAARYRWLRDKACDEREEAPYVCYGDGDPGDFAIEGAELDAAIDQAMEKAD